MTDVFLHGFTGGPSSGQVAFANALRPSIAGHCDAASTPGWDAEVSRLAEICAGCRRLIGYSLGARLALAVALSGIRIEELVLISGRPGIADDEQRRYRHEQDCELADDIERDGVDAFVDRWRALPMWNTQASLPARVLEAQDAQRRAHRPAGLASSLRYQGAGAMPNLWPALSQLRSNVILITGRCDPTYSDIARVMASTLPSARCVDVPDVGHNVVLEAPRSVVEALG